MYKSKGEIREAQRRQSRRSTGNALRASMIAIEQVSKRLAKGKMASDEMVKRGKLPDVDKQMQTFIQKSLKGVLGHLGNIAGAVVNRADELKQIAAEGGGVGDVLKEEHPEKKRLRQHSVSPLSPLSPKITQQPHPTEYGPFDFCIPRVLKVIKCGIAEYRPPARWKLRGEMNEENGLVLQKGVLKVYFGLHVLW
ncbi:hypothetical protein R1sor_001898 [Riccia sorocarpa]|uniref:Uncharacterized protein n=1 Tax=Riccia sorocarpa TaxID=122646 RepID=A0ABD3H1F6_9MARC